MARGFTGGYTIIKDCMRVTSRKVIGLLFEQLRLQFVPVLHRLQGGPAAQGCLRKLLVVGQDIAVQRGFQFFAGAEVVRPKHFFDAAVEALDHAVGLGALRRGQAVFDAQVAAQQIELVLAGGRALAQAEQAVGELAAIIGQHRADVDRAGSLQVA